MKILRTLNEAQRRWFVAREALARGWGGIGAMEQLTGMSHQTIRKGIRELNNGGDLAAMGRIRQAGGGRKRLEHWDPDWMPALERIMAENTAGDPMSALRWTNKATMKIAEELSRKGHPVSANTVARRLTECDYSLQTNIKTIERGSHPERDRQFLYINRQVKKFHRLGQPILSVDCKKKEQVGNFKNPGREWRLKGNPRKVFSHDFRSWGKGTAIPYGAYDVGRNEGFVNVGMTYETSEFAVESLRRWWKLMGRDAYPGAQLLLVCADSGGSNGNRRRGWKYHLQQFANETGLEVTVCHYPPGTSKWNKIEHRMFSFISLTWRGQPLVSYETVVNLISSTRTKPGLRVKAKLDRRAYKKGVKISNEQMGALEVQTHRVLPQWNYTIRPLPSHRTTHELLEM